MKLQMNDYKKFLKSLKQRIQTAQVRTSLKVNQELVLLYWELGRSILVKQKELGWGAKVIDQLSKDLSSDFPEIKGFSTRNLKFMRSFAKAYPEELFVKQAASQIPWFHNIRILQKIKDHEKRVWYIQKTIQNAWSRSVLEHQIESKLHERLGSASTNFEATLPDSQSDLARQILKDPYNFDFLSLGEKAHERDLEKGLINHIQKFLLELGIGFAFVGSQVHSDGNISL